MALIDFAITVTVGLILVAAILEGGLLFVERILRLFETGHVLEQWKY